MRTQSNMHISNYSTGLRNFRRSLRLVAVGLMQFMYSSLAMSLDHQQQDLENALRKQRNLFARAIALMRHRGQFGASMLHVCVCKANSANIREPRWAPNKYKSRSHTTLLAYSSTTLTSHSYPIECTSARSIETRERACVDGRPER